MFWVGGTVARDFDMALFGIGVVVVLMAAYLGILLYMVKSHE